MIGATLIQQLGAILSQLPSLENSVGNNNSNKVIKRMKASYIAAELWRTFRLYLGVMGIIVALPTLIYSLSFVQHENGVIISSAIQEILSSVLFVLFLRKAFAHFGMKPQGGIISLLAVAAFYQMGWLINHVPSFLSTVTDSLSQFESSEDFSPTFLSDIDKHLFFLWNTFLGIPLVFSFRSTVH